MRNMSKEEFNLRMKKIKDRNETKERKAKLRAEKIKYLPKLKLPPTSKLVMLYLFIILNVVLVYSMVAMWHFGDLTALSVIITDIVGQILIYAIYSTKAAIENKVGGITHDMAIAKLNLDSPSDTEDTEEAQG